jgi:serine/threonine protein kinase
MAKVAMNNHSLKLVKLIARGTLSQIWQAELGPGVPVAVKMIPHQSDTEIQRELHGLALVRNLRHRHLIAVHAYWSDGRHLFIIMELAEGNFADQFSDHESGCSRLSHAELKSYLKQAAEALDYLHGNEVAHGNVQPENLLLVRNCLKLTDFGAAERVATTTSNGEEESPQRRDQRGLLYTYVDLRLGRARRDSAQLHNRVDKADFASEISSLPREERNVLLTAFATNFRESFQSCLGFAEALAKTL